MDINQQIEALQRRKLKIELYNKLVPHCKKIKGFDDDLFDEVIGELAIFASWQIVHVQEGVEELPVNHPFFESKELHILKQVAVAAIKRGESSGKEEDKTTQRPIQEAPSPDPSGEVD